MSERLKIGLVGAGVFAGYHANKLAGHPRVIFTGVMDKDAERAEKLGGIHGVEGLSLGELLKRSDAIVIASPAKSHGRIAVQALQAGCHCLIEKPLAISTAEAEQIVALVTETGLTVQVGHQERLVLKSIGLDKVKERPVSIEAVRNSPYSPRGTDTSVTFDLMSHDIDLCTFLLGSAPDDVEGAAIPVRSTTPDKSFANLTYGECKVFLGASRVAEGSRRVMKITYPSGVVEIDFNAKTLTHTTPFDLNTDFAGDPRAKDSLGSATDIFVRAILDNNPVLVTAEEGMIAVKTARLIDGTE